MYNKQNKPVSLVVEDVMDVIKPDHTHGYTNDGMYSLCTMLDIDKDTFSKHLGVRTALIENGKLITYERDVYRALVRSLMGLIPEEY